MSAGTADLLTAIAALALVAGCWFVVALVGADERMGVGLADLRRGQDVEPGPDPGHVVTAITDRLVEVLYPQPGAFQRPVDLGDVALIAQARNTAASLDSR